MIYDRWTDDYTAFFAGRMADVKSRVEQRENQEEPRRA